MITKESIPVKDYVDDYQVPYLAEFANACREHITISGVKNCFVIKCPLYLEGEIKTLPILVQYIGNDTFSCTRGDVTVHHSATLDLKQKLAEALVFTRMYDEETGDVKYGMDLHMPFLDLKSFTFSITPIVTGTYNITCMENGIDISLPNLNTRYAVQCFMDLLKVLYTNFYYYFTI